MVAQHSFVPASYTVSSGVVRGIVECAVKCGVPFAALERFADVDAVAAEGRKDERYSGEVPFRLWERIVQSSRDPIIGFRMAQVSDYRTFGLLGEMLFRCPSVLDACRLVERYLSTLTTGNPVKVEFNSEALQLTTSVAMPNGLSRNNALLWVLSNLAKIPNVFATSGVRPRLVECDFAPPEAAAARELLEILPFKFNAPHNRVTFEASVGKLQIPTADENLRAYLIELADHKIERLSPDRKFDESIKALLRHMIHGVIPTVQDLCRKTGMSQRTLQRRLAEESTTFNQLLQTVLHELANDLLARPDISQAEIARYLGYSEESAFSRAYRSWAGLSPGEFRARTLRTME